ncbi:hypothetical protein DPMN_097989 [Dreissena polymorpha]|uniref:Uncharacterized protein n=1 Tax=Dreissena polymorpha TaxID=45954 RepID=A0A9D4R682_DREPO|nr:hypothetical protein DPMN_097989 [Dreissena polymorpha]
MEFNAETSEIIAYSTNNTNENITMNGEKLEEVTSFTYVGATLTNDGTGAAFFRKRTFIATNRVHYGGKKSEMNLNITGINVHKSKCLAIRDFLYPVIIYMCISYSFLCLVF